MPLFNDSRCYVLDEIGDTSSMEERRRYFHEVDVDQSDGVDFGEFLEVYTGAIFEYLYQLVYPLLQFPVVVFMCSLLIEWRLGWLALLARFVSLHNQTFKM